MTSYVELLQGPTSKTQQNLLHVNSQSHDLHSPPNLILQVPDAILVSELLVHHPTFGQDADLKPTHVEQQIRVVLAVHRNKASLPLDSGDGPGKAVLDLPENSTSSVKRKRVRQKRE